MPYISRRRFLQSSSLAALAASCPALWAREESTSRFKNLISPERKLRIACIGAGGKGVSDIGNSAGEDIVAICDVDFERAQNTMQLYPQAARYRDFRQMLDEMHDKIDAVTISTPDHTHFPAAMLALERGKHIYVQKPLTHTITEVRLLKKAAAKAGVVTQMGNQGHANEGTRLIKEWIEAGVIGNVREVHCWTNRPIWPQGIVLPKPGATIPETMDWNLWLGVAPYREYSPEIAPFKWRGFWDYGCGALGDMGCHGLDAPFWALNLRGNVKVSAVSEGNSDVCAPKWAIVTFEYPARGALPPVKLVWYDGSKQPPIPEEMGKDAKLPSGGAFYKGDKGTIFSQGDYSAEVRLIPEERMQSFKNRPPKSIPRIPKGNPHLEWINACKGGPIPGSNIVDHSADLTEMVSLGNVAIRMGKPIEWDAAKGVCVGMPEADRYLTKSYRLF
ncbi:MAG: Gfo/Idh/MocA family oxidoreductase [Opitutae bacterium]|nr:Gfo/Idh/MocA family oxidoreductase [Opitutae bacterium]